MKRRRTPKPAVDVQGVRAALEPLVKNGQHEAVIAALFQLVEKLSREQQELMTRYLAALRQPYRRKSEQLSPDQLALFMALLPAADAAQADVELADVPPPASKPAGPEASGNKKKPLRRALPDSLRREIVPIPVPADERTCECGHEKTPIRFEAQLTLEYKPAELYVIEHRREIVACKRCQEGVVTAPAAPKPVEGGRPGPGLLAHLVTSKFHDGLPLYRQSKIFARSGLEIAPSTLGDWCAAAAELAEPLWRRLREQALSSYLISLDDTGMPVLDRDHPKGIKRGHIWTFLADGGRIAFCEYTPDWKGKWPTQILSGFQGRVLQSDGYAGINAVFEGPDPPKRAGCLDHCRRKFVDALDAGDARAAVVISLLQDVYAVEAKARQDACGLDELLARRNAQSRLVMNRVHLVVAELAGRATPKSPLGKAVTYAINQWQTLIAFLDDPRIPVANAHVERQQRRTAVGRKNYLFAGSDEGARRLAILQTLVINCDLGKVSIFDYLRDTFSRLAAGWPMSRLDELLPAAYRADQPRQQQ